MFSPKKWTHKHCDCAGYLKMFCSGYLIVASSSGLLVTPSFWPVNERSVLERSVSPLLKRYTVSNFLTLISAFVRKQPSRTVEIYFFSASAFLRLTAGELLWPSSIIADRFNSFSYAIAPSLRVIFLLLQSLTVGRLCLMSQLQTSRSVRHRRRRNIECF